MKTIFKVALLLTAFSWYCHAQHKNEGFYLKADFKSVSDAMTAKDNAVKELKNGNPKGEALAKDYNILGIYQDLTGSKDSAIFYFNKTLALVKNNNIQKLHPLINLAIVYNNLGYYNKALQLANRALAINKKYGNNVDKALINEVFAVSYLNRNDNEKSVKYLLEGIAILEKEKNTKYLGSFKINLANTYIYSNNYAFAADLYEDYLNRYKKDSLNRMYSIAVINYAETLLSLKQYQKAYTLLEKNISLTKKSSDIELEGSIYAKLAKIDMAWNNTDKALINYKKAYELLSQRNSKYSMPIVSDYLLALEKGGKHNEALQLITSFNNSVAYKKANIYDIYDYKRSVARIYAKAGRLKESNITLYEALAISDSLRYMADDAATEEVQAKFQTQFQREKNNLLSKNNKALNKKINIEERMLYVYIFMSLALLVLILLFLRGYWLKSRLQKQTLKSIETEKAIIEQQHQYEQEITNTQKLTIDEKQREVTSMALRLASFYDTVNGIIEKCDNGTFVKMSDVKKDLMSLTKQKDYWNNFETRFNSLNPNFESNLLTHFPALSKNDIQFCALLKLNLSYKEIASLLQISYESAVTKKYRIKKKMGITDDNEFEKIIIEI